MIRAAHAESKRRVQLRKLLQRQGLTDSEIKEAVDSTGPGSAVLRSAPASEPRGGRGSKVKPSAGMHLCGRVVPVFRVFVREYVQSGVLVNSESSSQ